MAKEQKQEMSTEQYDPARAPDPESGVDQAVLGPAWMYKPIFKLGKWEAPYFASPEFQLYLVSFVCFLCPGMFNAVSGLGGGGQVNATDVNNSNTALYSTFAVVGFFAGSIANRIGLRLTLSMGGLGYFLYVASLLSYNINQNAGFLIFAGAFLGVCAGLLWCAQGAVMLSYPQEHEKGKYIAVFWVIFNLGGVIGSLVRSIDRSIPQCTDDSRFPSAKTCTPQPAASTMAPILPSWSSWPSASFSAGVSLTVSISSVRTDRV
jgi:MFS family permease